MACGAAVRIKRECCKQRTHIAISASPAPPPDFRPALGAPGSGPRVSVTADATILTAIVSTNPLHFVFDASEALVHECQPQNAGRDPGTQARVRLQDETATCTPGASISLIQ